MSECHFFYYIPQCNKVGFTTYRVAITHLDGLYDDDQLTLPGHPCLVQLCTCDGLAQLQSRSHFALASHSFYASAGTYNQDDPSCAVPSVSQPPLQRAAFHSLIASYSKEKSKNTFCSKSFFSCILIVKCVHLKIANATMWAIEIWKSHIFIINDDLYSKLLLIKTTIIPKKFHIPWMY